MEIKNKYGYVRVSSKTQESNFSIESQKQQLIQNEFILVLKTNNVKTVTNLISRTKYIHFKELTK